MTGGVPVKIIAKDVNTQQEWQFIVGQKYQLEITRQKLIHREHDDKLVLSLIVRNPDSGLSLRIEDDHVIKKIVKSFIHNHLAKTANPAERIFYRQMATRIIEGYNLEKTVRKAQKPIRFKAITSEKKTKARPRFKVNESRKV